MIKILQLKGPMQQPDYFIFMNFSGDIKNCFNEKMYYIELFNILLILFIYKLVVALYDIQY